jgi:hypothetical protein
MSEEFCESRELVKSACSFFGHLVKARTLSLRRVFGTRDPSEPRRQDCETLVRSQ